MANTTGNFTVMVEEPSEQFLSPKKVLKAVRKKNPRSVVVIAVNEEGHLEVCSSHLRMSSAMMDLVEAQHELIRLARDTDVLRDE